VNATFAYDGHGRHFVILGIGNKTIGGLCVISADTGITAYRLSAMRITQTF